MFINFFSNIDTKPQKSAVWALLLLETLAMLELESMRIENLPSQYVLEPFIEDVGVQSLCTMAINNMRKGFSTKKLVSPTAGVIQQRCCSPVV